MFQKLGPLWPPYPPRLLEMAAVAAERSREQSAAAPNRPLLLRLIDFVNNCLCHFPPQDNCVCAQISLLTFLSQPFVQALRLDPQYVQISK